MVTYPRGWATRPAVERRPAARAPFAPVAVSVRLPAVVARYGFGTGGFGLIPFGK